MGKMNDFLLGVYWDALLNANDNMHDLEKQKSQVSFSPFQTEPSSNVGLEQTSDDAPMLSVISYFNTVGLAYMICCLAVWTFHIYCSVCIFPNKVILFNLSSSLPIPLGCVEWSLNTYSSQHLSCHCLLFPVACTILVLILESKEMACCYLVQSKGSVLWQLLWMVYELLSLLFLRSWQNKVCGRKEGGVQGKGWIT